ncbi:uncharacterized protein BDW47DRAFT_125066 [Aspergillus candidus]|uniref:Uncharacterized protein n=1 Tax=Aspergillus candidus TaxID=41067 RepID=A0A2I2FDX6_ASPCN|nr:hypothetical protein BDW47DRAFT_125066 [Aspergillus candidus]PLB38836.1 hypothetical protein BDW47DRAFT_125066 [Aspergillus candidus]
MPRQPGFERHGTFVQEQTRRSNERAINFIWRLDIINRCINTLLQAPHCSWILQNNNGSTLATNKTPALERALGAEALGVSINYTESVSRVSNWFLARDNDVWANLGTRLGGLAAVLDFKTGTTCVLGPETTWSAGRWHTAN